MDEKRCATCHQLRPLSDFNVRTSAPDGLQARCRECARQWYEDNKVEHKERVRERNARVRAENQEHLARYLREHPCVDCGEADLRVLDFDHEDPSQKSGNIGRWVTYGLPWSRIVAEIVKCSVRCANCHRVRTSGDQEWWRTAAEDRRQRELQDRAAARLATILA